MWPVAPIFLISVGSALLSSVAAALAHHRSRAMGPPPYPATVTFKARLQAHWFGCPTLRWRSAGRPLSFRRFCGVPLDPKTPDHSTIRRFREELGRSGIAAATFGCVTRLIEQAGLILKIGTLIDESLMPAEVTMPAPPDILPTRPDRRPASKLVRIALEPDAASTRTMAVATSATRRMWRSTWRAASCAAPADAVQRQSHQLCGRADRRRRTHRSCRPCLRHQCSQCRLEARGIRYASCAAVIEVNSRRAAGRSAATAC